MNSPTGQTRRRIFTLDGSNDEDSHLLGVSLILLPFRGWSPPKTPIFGTCIGVFKPVGQNIENYCINFNQILHNDRDHQVVIVGGPNRRLTNPRWRTAAILKTVKSPYLCNRLTNFDEIWHGDAHWPITVDRPLKFRIFENPRCRPPPSSKSQKSRYLSMVWPIFTKFGMLMQNWSKKIEFQKSKMAYSCHFENCISATFWLILMKFSTVTHAGPQHLT